MNIKFKTKKIIIFTLLAVLLLTAVGCNPQAEEKVEDKNDTEVIEEGNEEVEESSSDKILKYGGNLEPVGNLDVHLTNYSNVIQISAHMQEALLGKETDTLEIVPVLLEEMPEVSEDGKTYTCKLKEGVKFHNGTELTTEDVKFTFEKIFDPETQNINASVADMIVGAKDILDGKTKELEGLKVIDDYNFEIEIEEVNSSFFEVLAKDVMCIYPKDAYEEAGDKWGSEVFIGTGPFKLKDFSPKDKVIVEKFEDYHGEEKKLDGIEFLNMDEDTSLLEFEKGNLDVVRVSTDQVDKYLEDDEYKDNVHSTQTLGIVCFGLNREMKPLDDLKVRQAVNLAIDRDELINDFLRGHAVMPNGFAPKGMDGYDESMEDFEYNPEKAKELLAEAGYPDGIELNAIISEAVSLVPVVEVVQEQFKKANITLNIDRTDHASYVDLRSAGEVQIPLIIWSSGGAPDSFFRLMYADDSKTYSNNYFNEEYDALYEKARRTLDEDERREVYEEMNRKVMEDMVVAPLYYPESYYLVSDRTENAKLLKTSFFRFTDAEIK